MTTVIKNEITYETCPACDVNSDSAAPCPLCEGRGQVPTDDAYYLSGGLAYSSAWWTCDCFRDYLHPDFCEQCERCGVTRDDGSDALATEVALYMSRLKRFVNNVQFRSMRRCGMPTFYTNGAYLVPEVLADGRIAWVVSSFEDDTFADGVELETPNANEGGCLGEDDYHRHAERHASEETRDLSRCVCARQAEGVLHG